MLYPPGPIGEERNLKSILLGQLVHVCLDGFSDLTYTVKTVVVAVMGQDGAAVRGEMCPARESSTEKPKLSITLVPNSPCGDC